MKTKVVTTSEVVTDDLTGKEITGGGWELRGLTNGVELHFQGIGGLVAYLLSGKLLSLSGNTIRSWANQYGASI